MKIFVFTNIDWYLIERLKGVLERSSIAAWSYNNDKNNKHINNSNKNILNPHQVVYSSKALFTPHFIFGVFSARMINSNLFYEIIIIIFYEKKIILVVLSYKLHLPPRRIDPRDSDGIYVSSELSSIYQKSAFS